MQTYRNLTIIGTSHIAQESLDTVKKTFEKEDPDIVAVELDKRRAAALLSGKQRGVRFSDIRRIGLKGYFFALLGGWAEKKLGSLVGVAPGSEMKQAILLAKKHKKRISFIDQDVEKTLRRLSQELRWKEKWNFFLDILGAVFGKKEAVGFDLRKVPNQKIIDKLMGRVKKRYPSVYKVLIVERNDIMARNLAKLLAVHDGKKIMAVVGAGHEEEILRLVQNYLDQGVVYSTQVSFGKGK